MNKRLMLVAGGLAAVAVGPMLCYKAAEKWQALRSAQSSSGEQQAELFGANPTADIAAGPGGGTTAVPHTGTATGLGSPARSPAGGGAAELAPIVPLAEAFRFDITPEHVIRCWPRVTTGLAELPLQGYRVPLVTGTSEADLAGALTYYFDSRHQVQRITFQGTTGDVRPLVGLLTDRFKLVRRIVNDPALLLYEGVASDGRSIGVARIRNTPVLRAEEKHHRYEVQLVLERPPT